MRVMLAVLLFASTAFGQSETWDAARELERSGALEAAFLAYLRLPGGESAAVRLARPEAETYLALLRANTGEVPERRWMLVEADLVLALGDETRALELYRQVARRFALDGDEVYPVELSWRDPPRPFVAGPGSHRDNRLVRRFIALDAWDDAERELERIRVIHRRRAAPWIIERPLSSADPDGEKGWFLVEPHGFSGGGLQFAIDMAYFLLRREKADEALAILTEPLFALDFDHNPNRHLGRRRATEQDLERYPKRRARYTGWGSHDGISRKEFLRLAFGAFRLTGKEDDLVRRVEREAVAGNARLLRVLARLHLLRRDPDAALAAELAYVDAAEFDPVSASLRRGAALESLGRLDRAAAEYEAALARRIVEKPDLPDEDEEPRWHSFAGWWPNPPFNPVRLRKEVLERLERIHASRGDLDASLDALRTHLVLEPLRHDAFDHLRSAHRKHRGAEREEVFKKWCLSLVPNARDPLTRAACAWFGGDLEATAAALADYSAANGLLGVGWKDRFRKRGPDAYRLLLTTVAKVRRDAGARLDLLALDGKLETREAIAVFEDLLDGIDGTASIAYRTPDDANGRTSFMSRFQAAYRLARLYDRFGETRPLVELGVAVAQGRAPYAVSQPMLFRNHEPDPGATYAQAIVALALRHAEDEDAERLSNSLWPGARAQALRLLGPFEPVPQKDIGWSPRVKNTRFLAAHDDVLDLARDEKYLYVAHPWGVAVHEFSGDPVTRIPLGEAANALAAGGGAVWAGTPRGLFRIRKGPWRVEHVRLDGDVAAQGKEVRDWQRQYVRALALDGGDLWIALARTVQILDTKEMELRPFAAEELGPAGLRIDLFVFDGSCVWTWGRNSPLRRYDRGTEKWSTVRAGNWGADLVGVVDGMVFATVELGEPLGTRLCRIDRESLEPIPLAIRGRDGSRSDPLRSFVGRKHGRPVFGPEVCALDPDGATLRPLAPPFESEKAEFERAWPISVWTRIVPREPGYGWAEHVRILDLPDGTCAIGRRVSNSSSFETLRSELSYTHLEDEILPEMGGLTLHRPDGSVRRYPDEIRGDLLPGTGTFFVLKDPRMKRVWIGTRRGLVLADEKLRILETYSRSEGLSTGCFIAGAVVDGRPAFADASGILTVFDFETRIFTTVFPPDMPGATAALAPLLRERIARTPVRRCPWLGGSIRTEYPHHWGKTIRCGTSRCGTRGVVIAAGATVEEPGYPELEVALVPGREARWLAEATARELTIDDPEALVKLLATENPYLRAEALASVKWRKRNLDPYLQPIATGLADPHPRVRATAVFLATCCEDSKRVIPLLQDRLDDPDRHVRSLAVLDLCRRGAPPENERLREVFSGSFDGHPFGARDVRGNLAGSPELWKALAPHLRPEQFPLLLEFPEISYGDPEKIEPVLGASVARHPDAARALLKAHGRQAVRTVRRILGAAGPAMLPLLHEALRSEDRVVRSNAARACGTIGDPSSVAHLVSALDLESGLSRASIVWALGELRARELIPHLGRLYEEVRNDERRERAAGYRFSQAVAEMGSRFDAIRDLASIGKEWDEIKAASRPPPLDPRRDEDLLGKKHILEALAKIGPELCQDFWRMVAAEDDTKVRSAAARWLGEAKGEDRDLSVTVLKRLVGDPYASVRAPAAVGLLLFGEKGAEASILEMLRDGPASRMLTELLRVPSFDLIRFAEKEIEAIAADPEIRSEWRNRAKRLLRMREPR